MQTRADIDGSAAAALSYLMLSKWFQAQFPFAMLLSIVIVITIMLCLYIYKYSILSTSPVDLLLHNFFFDFVTINNVWKIQYTRYTIILNWCNWRKLWNRVLTFFSVYRNKYHIVFEWASLQISATKLPKKVLPAWSEGECLSWINQSVRRGNWWVRKKCLNAATTKWSHWQ